MSGSDADRTAQFHAVDPDVDLHDPRQRAEARQWDIVLAIAAGGVLGAEARNALAEVLAHPAAGFPWSTVLINATGCLVLGAFMVIVLDVLRPHRLLRPLVGTGLLGGYTTFSTFAVDAQRLIFVHRPGAALGYIVATVVTCIGAVSVAMLLTSRLAARWSPARRMPERV